MSIRKRSWTNAKGEEKTAWVVDYVDGKGVRRLKTFAKKKDADQFAATAKVEVREGSHVADSASVTVKAAAAFWIATGEQDGLERSSIDQRKRHLKLHIEPFIGATLLSQLTVPAVREFADKLREGGRSQVMVRKVLGSLGALLSDAQERGLATRNPVRDLRGGRRRGKERKADKRQKGKLKVGIDIPTREEIKAIVGAATGRWRPLLITAVFTGMRSSELRGLRWSDVDLDRGQIRVHQRADDYGEIGRPKSEAGERTIPVPPAVISTLREWKVACPRRTQDGDGKDVKELHYVFPNGSGNIESRSNITKRGFLPTQVTAGVAVATDERDADGNAIMVAKYGGMHALRHFYASWSINRPQDGGLGLPPKVIQERLGHSSITMTLDTYGHLFPRGDDAEELAAAERSLLA
ncbi:MULTISPECIES: site-specific integrase [unclassified Mesorhizobium]|uniref:tyrosine-type recombinase/integrase n=1 Tax=unclassified Mesorhizobium TaxID=325217 RepID=UPI00112E3484|nr:MULTISPECIES: site-specific integrase [unclassified Mesorhizobium]TPK42620.1 site-specific integrase [Mesorhizobium sp. B2-5-2]TPL26740.1 site-specific integrase [Mesorhizobium sp. B2-4-7]TPL40518.1 site-specific integrase [Mesorhizobium sp. B2-4-5]TPM76792.1 site-specific integrase [Mesorhizobium sp. B2-1-6]TPN72455.1 site-specific integrase [Mesorhizobium sp. B1-1-2]